MLKKHLFLLLSLLFLLNNLDAQTDFPGGHYWSLDAGIGMTDILVEGTSYQFVIDPKLWLSPPLMVGSKVGVNYSTDEILTFEGQVYLRWNMLRLGSNPNKKFNLFIQGGLGLVAAYRGKVDNPSNPFNDATRTRGSLMGDAALGLTIPLTERWHIEPQVRGGYPHIWGAALTAGYKFPLPKAKVISNDVIRRIMIAEVEYIIFGPWIGRYNVDIDRDAQALNDLVISEIARIINENPNFVVRIEGHANPVTGSQAELDELLVLSSIRTHAVMEQLKAKGVKEEQMIVRSFGTTRTVTRERNNQNKNRRVELMIIQLDLED